MRPMHWATYNICACLFFMRSSSLIVYTMSYKKFVEPNIAFFIPNFFFIYEALSHSTVLQVMGSSVRPENEASYLKHAI